ASSFAPDSYSCRTGCQSSQSEASNGFPGVPPITTIVAIGGTPGKPFEASDWELWHPVRQLYESGAYEEAVERGRELLAAYPDTAVLLYNVACCESLTGRTADALEH